MTPRTLKCRKCGYDPTPEQFIDGLAGWWSALRVVQHTCPKCGEREDLQLVYSEVRFGYVYAAGSAHFSAEERASVPGLMAWEKGENLCVEYESKTREITA